MVGPMHVYVNRIMLSVRIFLDVKFENGFT